MGDPRRTRKKYERPSHPWIAARIEEEKELSKQFGTKNKRELYRMGTALKRFKNQAKALVSRTDEQAAVERDQLTKKLVGLGLVNPGATIDDILSLTVVDLMNRRLQTVLVKRLLARTTNQARQLIVHGHVLVGKKVITSPGYLVRIDQESQISFRASSSFNNEQHPERFSEEELKQQRDRAAAKKAEKEQSNEDEAPPAYKEEDLEDPEEATTLKKTEKTAEKKEEASEEAKEPKKEADAEPKKTEDDPKAETPNEKTEKPEETKESDGEKEEKA